MESAAVLECLFQIANNRAPRFLAEKYWGRSCTHECLGVGVKKKH